jgi:hypothetical protein
MTTLLWFAELLLYTPLASNTTNELYEQISGQMENRHYKKWEEIERL